MPKKHKPHMSPQKVALIKLLVLLFVFIFSAVLLVLWARQDADSALAKNVRDLIGLPAPVSKPEAVPEVVVVVVPEPVIVVEPEPMPEPIIVVPPAPVIVEMSFEEFVNAPQMWPKALELTLETSVPIIYRERDYGKLSFVPGQTIEVKGILETREVLGLVDGNYLVISADKTNLQSWFEDTHSEGYVLVESSYEIDTVSNAGADEYHIDLLEGLRKWCYINYGDCTFQITDDALILRWRPKEESTIDYRVEARSIARKYLQEQAARGATDNYAACEIYDLSTDRLLGIGAFFAPSLADLDSQ